mgnify:FL=1
MESTFKKSSEERPQTNTPGYITANPKSYSLIKEIRDGLKKNPTNAENLLWKSLRNKKTGYKIRRQHVIDNFIADFVCLPKKVVIEIDGKIHQFRKEYDDMRSSRFEELGYVVIRFTNEDVESDVDSVFLRIKQFLDETQDPNSPPLEGRGEVICRE